VTIEVLDFESGPYTSLRGSHQGIVSFHSCNLTCNRPRQVRPIMVRGFEKSTQNGRWNVHVVEDGMGWESGNN
jgi:hypothetical protein